MTCPKSNDCPFYGSRGDDWCDRKGKDCMFYHAWYNSKVSFAVMEETTQSDIIDKAKKRVGL